MIREQAYLTQEQMDRLFVNILDIGEQIKKPVHICQKEPDIEVVKTHVVYIKDKLDDVSSNVEKTSNSLDKKLSLFVTKREIQFYKYMMGGLYLALLTIAGWIFAK